MDGTVLRFTAKGGDVRKYRLSATVQFQGQEIVVTGNVTEKVVRVDNDGLVTLQVTASGTQAKVGPETAPVQDSPALTEIFKPDGTLAELRGENSSPTYYRMETLTSVKLPDFELAKDKTWTWDIAANPKIGLVKTTVTYRVIGDEKMDGLSAWKITRSIKELDGDTPATDEGTVWVSKTDGTLVKQVDAWKNAPVPNAPSAVDGTFTLERLP